MHRVTNVRVREMARSKDRLAFVNVIHVDLLFSFLSKVVAIICAVITYNTYQKRDDNRHDVRGSFLSHGRRGLHLDEISIYYRAGMSFPYRNKTFSESLFFLTSSHAAIEASLAVCIVRVRIRRVFHISACSQLIILRNVQKKKKRTREKYFSFFCFEID